VTNFAERGFIAFFAQGLQGFCAFFFAQGLQGFCAFFFAQGLHGFCAFFAQGFDGFCANEGEVKTIAASSVEANAKDSLFIFPPWLRLRDCWSYIRNNRFSRDLIPSGIGKFLQEEFSSRPCNNPEPGND